ncbi:hypothetical protein [Nocardioides caricicola]|uniref:Lipoprotein n=1 Tax=Nocardioides caricicola TaxID=634770 RepID=A0ABW0MY05_9ACTN
MNMRTAVAALTIAVLAGCSSDDGGSSAPPAPTPTASVQRVDSPSQPPAEPAPLDLHLDTGGTICFDRAATPDLAWFDVTWKANTDLDSFRFKLVNPVGVTKVGGDINVPPMNFGGQIPFGGAATWADRAKVLDDKFLFWSQRGPVAFWSPAEDETGLLVMHLRFDQVDDASFDGVTATYRTADGEVGRVTARGPEIYQVRDRC